MSAFLPELQGVMETKNKHEIWELRQMQALPLESKITMTKHRIQSWVDEFGIDRVCYYPKKMQNMTCYSCCDRTKCNAKIFERLAEYEDIGLSPAAVMEYKAFEDCLIQNNLTFKKVIELINKEFGKESFK